MIAIGAVALGCALIGIYQYFVRDLFLNPELFDANELHVYFRVNSIFFDPNVFGRYLALAITALAACMAWGSSRRDLTAAAVVCAVALVALVVQLLDHELRGPARRPRDRRHPALALARLRRLRSPGPRRASRPSSSRAGRPPATSRTCAASTPATRT